jgi:hypothetical protein
MQIKKRDLGFIAMAGIIIALIDGKQRRGKASQGPLGR